MRHFENAAIAARETPEIDLGSLTVAEVINAVRFLSTPNDRASVSRGTEVQNEAFQQLSRREIEVVRLVAEGLSNLEISKRLFVSDKTVKNHISHILAKMGLSARTQIAVLAIRGGLA